MRPRNVPKEGIMHLSKRCRRAVGLSLAVLLMMSVPSGCATVAERLAGTDGRALESRAYEARRITLADVPTPKSQSSTDESSGITTVAFEEREEALPLFAPPVAESALAAEELAVAEATSPTSGTYPIDLPTTLRLAGANNLQIAFAAEQVQAALAREDRADVLWVPSLRAGLIYNYHTGPIQDTVGKVVDVDRGSLFVGGGIGIGNSPLTGPAGGPRMFVDLSLVDALFEPLAARQRVWSAQANQTAAFNDTLLEATFAYISLWRASSSVAIAEEAVTNAEELARLTGEYARTGQGLQADADRARAELQSRQRTLLESKEAVAITSAELARILRLDPATRLVPVETVPVPLHLVDGSTDVYELIGQAQASRPELTASNAAIQETWYRTRQEHWRPWMPHLYAGMSGGSFGGGTGSNMDNFGGRADFDLAAIWQVENLGLGNSARHREQESLNRQAHLTRSRLADQIAMEVTQAHQRILFRAEQIHAAEAQVRSATEALILNLEGIQGGVLRPIEIQQAIGALASARQAYLDAVMDYNQAQFALLRALGQTPRTDAAVE
jgi:outer membrane protein TolC